MRIEKFAEAEGIEILKTYQDTGSAFNDEDRLHFNQMITDAIDSRINYIIADDSSRFARTQEVSVSTKSLLRKHNVDVLFANEFNVDSKSISGLWVDGIRDIKNQAHSMEIAQNTIRGMGGNIKKRDPETGWCYKNGGRAPYGYKIKSYNTGTNSKGKPIYKSVWELHPDNQKVVRLIIVDLYCNDEFSYEKIRDYLNNKMIAGPSGKPWGTSTIVEMLRPERLEQYAGIGFWNKENRKINGARFNPREEWIIVPNAHPAIINDEELESALKRKEKGKKNYTFSGTKDSPYYFSGKNIDGETLFTCSLCGGSVIGYRNSSNHWRKYICSKTRYNGGIGCTSNVKVNVEWLESNVLKEIKRLYTQPDNIEGFINDIKQEVKNGNQGYHEAISDLSNDMKKHEKEKENLLTAVKSGLNPSVITADLNELQAKIDAIENDMNDLKDNPPKSLRNAEESKIRAFFSDFSTAFENANNSEKKELIKTFVRQMVLNPEKQEVRVTFYPDLVHRIGVGRGT